MPCPDQEHMVGGVWCAVRHTLVRFAGRHVSCNAFLHAAGGMLDISRAMAFAPQRPQAAGAASPAEVVPLSSLLGVASQAVLAP